MCAKRPTPQPRYWREGGNGACHSFASPARREGRSYSRQGGSWGVGLFALLLATSAFAQPPAGEPVKKAPDTPKVEKADRTEKADAKPAVVKLPDGTFLWVGPSEGVTLAPQAFQKLLDQGEQLKKELAARKPVAPSGCAVRARVEKRGEQFVAVLKLTYTFRTAQANSAVALGGRRAFLLGAALDGAKLPVLDTAEDGFAALVEAAGDHALVLDAEVPVTAHGLKTEVGFDFGLPRAPITTLALDPPPGGVARVTLITKTPDPTRPAEARRTTVELKQLVAKGGEAGFPLGPVESLEVTWEPPAAVAQPADQVQSADLDVSVVLTEGSVEATAKVRVRGPGRDWKLVAPVTADVSVDRVAAAGDTGPALQPTVQRPTAPNQPVWQIALPAGSTGADWQVTAVVRQARPKAGAKAAPVPVGPFAVLDVLRQTGTVLVKAGPNTRFAFKHGPDLRRAELPGGAEEDVSAALFRLTTGPTGATAVSTPLLSVEAFPVEGAVRVRPAYRLELTEAGWKVRAEVTVKPIRTEVSEFAIDVPAEWGGLEFEFAPDVIQGVSQGKAEGAWVPATARLVRGTKQPFSVVLLGTVRVPPGAHEAAVPFPRYPKAVERDALMSATVPDGSEVRGTWRGWDGEAPGAGAQPLVAAPGADGKPPKVVTAVASRAELGFARATLVWQPHRPDVTAEVSTDVTVGERQVTVVQQFRLRAPDGFARAVKFRGPPDALGFKAAPALEPAGPGAWAPAPGADAKEAAVRVVFALPLPAQADGPLAL
ncbi:MAG: hypothetical protein ACKODX_07160, partial [Gemmata sp.]